MEASLSPLQTKALRRASDAEYDLYKAALEWDLIEPIVIEDRDDLRSEPKWRERVKPYHHQVTNLITFCRRLPVTLLADDVGLGKTISAGLVVSELMSRGRVSKILVVCPKILMPQWHEELDAKFGLSSTIATGSDLREAQPPDEIGAVITTYQSARLHFDAIEQSGFQMLILDEAHKLRNLYGVEKTPLVARQFRQALADRVFKYVLMLTATPIQNRLWDLYSLIDLLTVARGHENPFGNEGLFARNFIADNRTEARHLKPERQEEFRSIVYGYMSRIRRADAKLHFPERIVQLQKVVPTPEELKLIEIIAEPIQKLNRLVQISILRALISSPHALSSQLNNMARKGTIAPELAHSVQRVVDQTGVTAKLTGLGLLVDKLRTEKPEHWRMVVFTTRRETQTTIQSHLEAHGISCGLINGDSSWRNQDTITKFKASPPVCHVIVSTEAGSEGVNLQSGNVLVNFDLPWNPMVVEQRIGRVQRLASEHASVCIFNVVLEGTFEEYIVGRLMEKLQMATQALGDIESLLEASGLNDDEDSGTTGFEEKIRQLVVSSLAGKDVEAATRAAELSIMDAKVELEREQSHIDSLLGGMDGIIDGGPRSPHLPMPERSMPSQQFVLKALESLGGQLTPRSSGAYVLDLDGKRDNIRLGHDVEGGDATSVLLQPGTPAFERLTHRISALGLHHVNDADRDISTRVEDIARRWVEQFGGRLESCESEDVWRCYRGTALVRVRATVAHDSYERLVNIECTPVEHRVNTGRSGTDPIGSSIDDPKLVGVVADRLAGAAIADVGISEFCRFYNERKLLELRATGCDERKRKKLEDDFTPRIEMTIVGLDGAVFREQRVNVMYALDGMAEYSDFLAVVPSLSEVVSAPNMDLCEKTCRTVPRDCLAKCEISGLRVLRHMLIKSEASGRRALPDFAVQCTMTGAKVLSDEVEQSAVSGQWVLRSLLKTSALSGKRAEPQYVVRCDFSSTDVLEGELATSEVSGKRYRIDEQGRSAVSGKSGHKSEFIFCAETNQPLLPSETETCEVTGRAVMPGRLGQCDVTGRKVLRTELETCSASGRKALKTFFVSSSMSGARILEKEALRSINGKYCAPAEGKICLWSGYRQHPDDVRTCELTRIPVRYTFTTSNGKIRLEPLVNLLEGILRTNDESERWPGIATIAAKTIGSRNIKVEAATSSPDGQHLAICFEVKTLLGLRTRYAGLIYSIQTNSVVGRVALGKREAKGWVES